MGMGPHVVVTFYGGYIVVTSCTHIVGMRPHMVMVPRGDRIHTLVCLRVRAILRRYRGWRPNPNPNPNPYPNPYPNQAIQRLEP